MTPMTPAPITPERLAEIRRVATRCVTADLRYSPSPYLDLALRDLLAAYDHLAARLEKAEAFKRWCHNYLDAHGVPHHPPGVHGAEGCRIGDRMDWLMERVRTSDALKAENEQLEAALREVLATATGHAADGVDLTRTQLVVIGRTVRRALENRP